MKKLLKPNVSPLEVEVDSKLVTAYLFAALAKAKNVKLIQMQKSGYAFPQVELPITNNLSINEKPANENN
jgi:hypothetical protein